MRGGLRSRLIVDSVRVAVIAGLENIGWFDPTIHDDPPGLRHHQPFRYITRPGDWQDPITANSFAISAEDINDEPQGLGGDVEDTFKIYIDLFAEDAKVGWHLAGDIRDLLLGRLPATGRLGPVVDVFDFRQATPSPFTQVDIDNVTIDRADGEARQWQHYWFMIRLDIVDDYADEYDATHLTVGWYEDLRPAWDRIQAVDA